MPKLAVVPFVLKDVILTIGTDDYARHVDEVLFTPTVKADPITWQGLSPDASFSDAGVPETSWALTLTYAQDWDTANSLSAYLLANAGLSKTVVFQPKTGSGKATFTATVTIAPGPIGGKGKQAATASVTMPLTGAPVKGVSA